MILRRTFCVLPTALLLLITLSIVSAGDDFDCHINVNDLKFDLTRLHGERTINRTRETFPSVMIDSLRFDLCGELKRLEGIEDEDQCPPGTRACLTKINRKHDIESVISVIPVMHSEKLEPEHTTSSSSPKYLNIIFNGQDYPSPVDPDLIHQSLNLTLFCDPEGSDPKFIAYDGLRVDLEWSTPAGCPLKDEDNPKNDDDNQDDGRRGPEQSVGSSIGWFFLMILLSFAAYFVLGGYYNYSTYGARGVDLIPHRDFWQEVPYMLKDVLSHLCSAVRPRRTSSRGGYISV